MDVIVNLAPTAWCPRDFIAGLAALNGRQIMAPAELRSRLALDPVLV